MKIDCKIKSIGETHSGVNAKTGNTWYIKPIEIEWQESRTRHDGTIYAVENTLMVDLSGDHAKNFSLQVGQAITVDVRFQTAPWNNRLMNNIRSSYIILR